MECLTYLELNSVLSLGETPISFALVKNEKKRKKAVQDNTPLVKQIASLTVKLCPIRGYVS